MAEENYKPIHLRSGFLAELGDLSSYSGPLTVERFIVALQATRTLKELWIDFSEFESTPETSRRIIEPLCCCIANLRRHNQNHPLRKLIFCNGNDGVDQFLVAAKQFGIQRLDLIRLDVKIKSFVEFCRDNTHLNVLEIQNSIIFDQDSTISVKDGPQDCSVIMGLNKLTMMGVVFENSSVATEFSNFMAHVTYPALRLGRITVRGGAHDVNEKKIVSELIKPSIAALILDHGCRIDAMDAIEACATVTHIQLSSLPPIDFTESEERQKLQEIATRNRELALFVANPDAYPSGDELLALMRQFNKCPTGRYMLARCYPEIPSLLKIHESPDSSATEQRKRKRIH